MPADAGRSLIESGIPQDGASVRRRPRGVDAPVLLVVRVLVGAGLLALGARVARAHADYALVAPDWGLPAPAPILWVGAVLAVLAGLLLVLGLAPRLGALVGLAVCLVAAASAGRVDGGLTLAVPALLALGCLVLIWRGGGSAQLLDRLDP